LSGLLTKKSALENLSTIKAPTTDLTSAQTLMLYYLRPLTATSRISALSLYTYDKKEKSNFLYDSLLKTSVSTEGM